MIRLAFGIFVIIAVGITFALAEPAPAPKTVTIVLTLEEAQQLLNAEAVLPWKDANALIQKIVAQINPQIVPPPKPEDAPETK